MYFRRFMSNYLLYLSYKKQEIHHQTIISVLTFLKVSTDSFLETVKIVIYTDNESLFKSYLPVANIIFEPIDDSLIENWKGSINFFFRAKIKLIEDFFSKYDGNMLYFDSDTYFLNDVSSFFSKIENNELFMHEYEGVFEQNKKDSKKESSSKRIEKILKSHIFKIQEIDVKIPINTPLWNAGVLGFSSKFTHVLQNVVELTDQLYQIKNAHIMEQFAFSYYLGSSGKLQPLNKEIFHYWQFKEFNEVIANYLVHYKNKGIESLKKNLDEIDPQKLSLPKMRYLKMAFFEKNFNKYFRGKWKMPTYKFNG
jgi:hypothetical protein